MRWMVAGVTGLVCLALGIFIGSSRLTANEPVLKTRQELVDLSDAFAEIAEQVNPSVVHISSSGNEPALDPSVETQEERPFGFGSGVLINAEGYILTSNHVIESAVRIDVKLSNNRQFTAKAIGQDRETDLAVIKVESKEPLPFAAMGDSDRLRPGQLVMAIGNPFIYEHTVTVGVISALNRKLGTTIFDNFIQTDAAINFGNSGGPLLNVKGEVIGINTLISSQGTGIGFSIPINTAKEILPHLIEKGKVSRGFLGLVPQEITTELQKALDLDQQQGVVIASVQAGTPAARAGLKRYDVIVEVEGKKVESEDQFRRMVAETPPNKKIKLKIVRNKQVLNIECELGERGGVEQSETPVLPKEDKPGKPGWKLEDLNAIHPSIPSEHKSGAFVQFVEPGTPASLSGLQRGDIILEINKEPVSSAAALDKRVREAKSGDVFLLYVFRFGAYTFLTLTIP